MNYTLDQLRKIDGLIEQHIFGHEIVCWEWPCVADRDGTIQRAQMRPADSGPRGPVYVKPDSTDFWPPVPFPSIPEWGTYAYVTPVPPYTTDWSHAGRVLEWLVPQTYYGYLELTQNPQTKMWCSDAEPGGMGEGEGATLQLAVCLHALAVAGVDVEKEVDVEKGVE